MKKHLYKFLAIFPIGLICSTALSSCGGSSNKLVLRVLNAADYIYEFNQKDYDEEKEAGYAKYLKTKDMMDQFVDYMKKEKGIEISFVYDTYDTNETMYNEMMTGKSSYDVIVASDYMVQKLISNDLVQPLPTTGQEISDIKNHVSPYLWNIFDGIHPKDPKTDERIKDKVLSQYSVPYMWGTVGIMYNPSYYANKLSYSAEKVHQDFESWNAFYSKDYNKTFSIKDSVRDVYAVSIIHSHYQSHIVPLEEKLEKGEITEKQFNSELTKIFNLCDNDTLKIIKKDMLKLKDNSFGFEVDSGKNDMAEGKLGGNLAWSGDAQWAIEQAQEEYEKELYFSIPKEGSNIWFDAFCIPKTSEKSELATAFIDFMCKPENAVQNMWSVGYTSAVSSVPTLEYIYECYDVRVEIGGESEEEYVPYDLSYFFSNCVENPDDAILHAYEDVVGRSLTAQFPEESDLPRLCVMDDFGTQNKAVINMWEKIRTNPLPVWAIIILIVEGVVALGLILYFVLRKSAKKKLIKERRLGREKH